MTWKRIVSLEIVAIFLKKVNNSTPVHIVDVLAEDLSFCRAVMGGWLGYTCLYSSGIFLINMFFSVSGFPETQWIHYKMQGFQS